MFAAFAICGLFMIAVGNLCPHKYEMKDISSQEALHSAAGMAVSGAVKGASMAAKAAVDNKETLVEMKGKLSQKEALL